jgi:hypothetical protein
MKDEASVFDPFDAALHVRDALSGCKCCGDDEAQGQFEAAQNLLEWVVRTRERLAALEAKEALADGASAPSSREPLTGAERAKRYREKRKGVTSTVTPTVTALVTRHEKRHGAVTPSVTVAPSRASSEKRSSSGNSESSSALGSDPKRSAEARGRVTERDGQDVTNRDAPPAALTAKGDAAGGAPATDAIETLNQHIEATFGIRDHVAIAFRVAEHLFAQGLGLRQANEQKHASDLYWIGQQPLADVDLVVHHALADEWVKKNPGYVDPKHLCERWTRYLQGDPVRRSAEAGTQEDQARAARAQRLRDLQTLLDNARQQAEGWGPYKDLTEEDKARAAVKAHRIEAQIEEIENEARAARGPKAKPLARAV